MAHHTWIVKNGDEHGSLLLRFCDPLLFMAGWHLGVPFRGVKIFLRITSKDWRFITSDDIQYVVCFLCWSFKPFTSTLPFWSPSVRMHGTNFAQVHTYFNFINFIYFVSDICVWWWISWNFHSNKFFPPCVCPYLLTYLPYFSDYKTHFFPWKMWPKIDLRLIHRG